MKTSMTLSMLLGITLVLLIGCVDQITTPDPTDTSNGTDTSTVNPVATTAPVIRGRVTLPGAGGLGKSAETTTGADQLWVIPVYERTGGFEDGISFMSLSSTIILSLDSNGNFSYAYADQNAPEGVPVIDAFTPTYPHTTPLNPTDRSVFSGNVLMVLANSHKAASLDLADRKGAILGYVSLDAAHAGSALIGIPLSTVTSEADIDLGDITPDDEGDEALAETPLADVEEFFQLSLSQLLAMAGTDDLLKGITNEFVNSKIVPREPDSSVTTFYEHGKDNANEYEFWHGKLSFSWGNDSIFKPTVSNAPSLERWVEDWNLGGGGFMEPGNTPTQSDPVVYTLGQTVWQPTAGFADLTYTGYRVMVHTGVDITGASITPPPLVDMTGVSVVPGYATGTIVFAHEDQQAGNHYFTPGPGESGVAPGWWDVEVGGAVRASFQMDLYDPFDADNNVRALVPRLALEVSDVTLSPTLWQWNREETFGAGSGTIVPDSSTTVDTGRIWIQLEELTGLNITWYWYNPATGSYEPADPALSPSVVDIDVSLRLPHRFESYNLTDYWPEAPTLGQGTTPEINETFYTFTGKETSNIQLDLTNTVRLAFVPNKWGHFDLTGADGEKYAGELRDGVYWSSMAGWAAVRSIHIRYRFNGVEFLFTFGIPH